MNLELRHVDIQFLVLFMLISPGVVYLYLYRNSLFVGLDFAKIALLAIAHGLALSLICYVALAARIGLRVVKLGINSWGQFGRLAKIEKSIHDPDRRAKTELDAAIKKSSKQIEDYLELVRDTFLRSMGVEVPLSVACMFIGANLTTLLSRFVIGLTLSRAYIITEAVVSLGLAISVGILLPLRLDYYLSKAKQ